MLEDLMGGGFDLAAVASAAGLGGGVVSSVAAMMFFKGVILRVVTQLILTTILTGVGFIVLLNVLGFQIVPRDNVAAAPPVVSDGLVAPQSMPSQSAEAPAEGEKVYYVKSPFRKS
jgi:hypothetical protein